MYSFLKEKIPVITIGDDTDFEQFILKVVYKNIWVDRIRRMGASFIFGKSTHFIVLSKKPYSNVPAKELNLSDAEWKEKSLLIRREHECVHYYTKIKYGISRNSGQNKRIAYRRETQGGLLV